MNNVNGYVYILTHVRMPGLVKIGLTTTTVGQRVAEINANTGVPGRFTVFCSFPVSDPQRIESVVHRKLRPFRLVTNKEFFELKPLVAKQYVNQILEEAEFGVRFDPAEMTLLSDSQRLGGLIKAHRKKRRMRQSDVAAKVGTGLRFIIEIERGKPTAQIGKVLAVLATLGIRVAIDSPDKDT